MKIAAYLVAAPTLAAGIMAAVILASVTAQAQQQAMLTLSCKGTVTTGSEDPQQVTMGIVVNFATRRVQGLQAPGVLDYPLTITAADDAIITFQGTQKMMGDFSVSTLGTIDRVNGDVDATLYATKQSSTVYALNCRPAQRMF